MSKEAKIKEQINNLRGLLVGIFSMFLVILTGRVNMYISISMLIIGLLLGIYAFVQMNKKLDELEKN